MHLYSLLILLFTIHQSQTFWNVPISATEVIFLSDSSYIILVPSAVNSHDFLWCIGFYNACGLLSFLVTVVHALSICYKYRNSPQHWKRPFYLQYGSCNLSRNHNWTSKNHLYVHLQLLSFFTNIRTWWIILCVFLSVLASVASGPLCAF
jgi:hypothetical protein